MSTAVYDDDVFNRPDIVDCDILEAAKENVQPLAAGRRVTVLSSLLTTPQVLRHSKLSATRQRLRMNVEIALEDEDDDPLEAYCQLVYWVLENYPEGNNTESGLLELLEEATRILRDHSGGKFKHELKYLKLWVLYASYVEKPTIIFRFLIANDIGSDHALLYEEFAGVLERDGRRKDADEIYALGVARRASPLDHLKARRAEFQKRMMFAPSVPTPTPETTTTTTTTQTSTATTTKKRTILGVTSDTTPTVASRPPAAASPAIPQSSSSIPIFVDPSGSESQSAEFETNPWPELGTRKTRIKENVPDTKKFNGTTLKQAGKSKRAAVTAGHATSRIVPYVDPPEGSREQQLGDMAPPAAIPPKKASSSKTSSAVTTPAKAGFVPFVDEEDQDDSKTSRTPKFTPYCDPELETDKPRRAGAASSAFATAAAVPNSVMKAKKVDPRSSAPISEAEALRKDPLKNYGSEAALLDP